MYSKDFFPTITQKFSSVTEIPSKDKFIRDPDAQLNVPADQILAVCQFLKQDATLAFDLPIQMTAIDYIKENQFELVYYLYSTKKKHAVILKSRIDRAAAEIDSVTGVWSGMDWQEREVFDLMGINFKGHPYMKRIMLWEGYPGFPLRKDYVHVTDKYDSGMEIGTPGLDEKGLPVKKPV